MVITPVLSLLPVQDQDFVDSPLHFYCIPSVDHVLVGPLCGRGLRRGVVVDVRLQGVLRSGDVLHLPSSLSTPSLLTVLNDDIASGVYESKQVDRIVNARCP